VAAVYRLHGPLSVIEHPGLGPLRTGAAASAGRRDAAADLEQRRCSKPISSIGRSSGCVHRNP
jgi:hypothetical protein